MVSDQEIAKGVETVLRQSDPNVVTSYNGVVQQLEAKLGLNLSHKTAFIHDQINLLLRSHPVVTTTSATTTTASASSASNHQPQPPPQPQILQFAPKDHFALHHQHYPQFQHYSPHFALYAHQQHQLQQHQHHPHPQHQHQHHPHQHQHQHQHQVFPQDLNFCQPQPLQLHPQQPVQQPQVRQKSQHATSKSEVYSQSASSVVSEIPKESAPVGTKRRGGPGGLNKVCGVSPELQVVVGEPALPRTEIVKQLWAYIRKNNLQDPSNKRKIICDDALRVVFETDCTDMFKMNKLLAKHILPLESTKESGQAKRAKVDIESKTENAEPGPILLVISEALAKFLGAEVREMTQLEASKLVWEYIKSNHLEDPLNSMVILCDEKLRELLGCESISAVGVEEMLARHHLFKR